MEPALPLARTNAEAHIYLDLHPCEQCDSPEFARTSSVIEVGGERASEYRGPCASCGRDRLVVFRLPAEVFLPAPGQVYFGAGRSELLDPGEWLAVADAYALATPEAAAPTDRDRAKVQVSTAAAALDQVLAFVPADADEVPYEAIRTERGRAVYDAEPGRFGRERLEVVRASYRDQVAELSR